MTGTMARTISVSCQLRLNITAKAVTKPDTMFTICHAPKPSISRTALRSPVRRFIRSPVRARS